MQRLHVVLESLSASQLTINALEFQLLHFVLDLLIHDTQHEGSHPARGTFFEPLH